MVDVGAEELHGKLGLGRIGIHELPGLLALVVDAGHRHHLAVRKRRPARTRHEPIGRVGDARHGGHQEGVRRKAGANRLPRGHVGGSPDAVANRSPRNRRPRKPGLARARLHYACGRTARRSLPARLLALGRAPGTAHYSSTLRIAMKASCGTSTEPMAFIRFLPSFCFSSSLRLREMSPP